MEEAHEKSIVNPDQDREDSLDLIISGMPELLKEIDEIAEDQDDENVTKSIGLIGLGPIGLVMLFQLIHHYPMHRFIVFDRDNLDIQWSVNVTVAANPAEVANQCSIIFTKFFDIKCVEQVI